MAHAVQGFIPAGKIAFLGIILICSSSSWGVLLKYSLSVADLSSSALGSGVPAQLASQEKLGAGVFPRAGAVGGTGCHLATVPSMGHVCPVGATGGDSFWQHPKLFLLLDRRSASRPEKRAGTMLLVGEAAVSLSSRAFRAEKVSMKRNSAGLEAPAHRISYPTGRVRCLLGAGTTTVHREPWAPRGTMRRSGPSGAAAWHGVGRERPTDGREVQ